MFNPHTKYHEHNKKHLKKWFENNGSPSLINVLQIGS